MGLDKYKIQFEMLSLIGLLIAVILIFYSAFGDRQITRVYFIIGAILAIVSLFLRFVGLIFK